MAETKEVTQSTAGADKPGPREGSGPPFPDACKAVQRIYAGMGRDCEYVRKLNGKYTENIRESYERTRKKYTELGPKVNAVLDALDAKCDRVRCGEPPLAAGLLVYRTDTRQVLVCVKKEKDGDTLHIVGGKAQRDETPIECCVREVIEETGRAVLTPTGATTLLNGLVPSIYLREAKFQLYVVSTAHYSMDPDARADPDSIVIRFNALRVTVGAGTELTDALEWVSLSDERRWSGLAQQVVKSAGVRSYLAELDADVHAA